MVWRLLVNAQLSLLLNTPSILVMCLVARRLERRR